VAIKISANNLTLVKGSRNEIEMLNCISRHNRLPIHSGFSHVQTLLSSFTIKNDYGIFPCMVFDPLQEHIGQFRRRFKTNAIPLNILKLQVIMILQGLDYLHSCCKIIHDSMTINFSKKLANDILRSNTREHYDQVYKHTIHSGQCKR
jgi:serine/threonine-protein kinase SRPK3